MMKIKDSQKPELKKRTDGSRTDKQTARCALAALCTALATVVRQNPADVPDAGIHNSILAQLYKLMEQCSKILDGHGFTVLVLFGALFFVYARFLFPGACTRFLVPLNGAPTPKTKRSFPVASEGQSLQSAPLPAIKGDRVLAAIFSILYTGGRAFRWSGSLGSLVSPKINLLGTIVLLVGFYFLYLLCIRLLHALISSRNPDGKSGYRKRFAGSHPVCVYWLLIMAFWSIHLIARFPGAMSYDNWNQLAYYYGVKPFTTAQPIFHTWLFGTFIRAGKEIAGSANLGLFGFVLMQSMLMAAALSCTIVFMKKWRAPRWLTGLSLFLYCVTPYFAGYAAFPIKDYLYTVGFLFWVMCILQLLTASCYSSSRKDAASANEDKAQQNITSLGSNSEKTKKIEDIKKIFEQGKTETTEKNLLSIEEEQKNLLRRILLPWILSVTLMILCRKNGSYVYIAASFCLLLVWIRDWRKTEKYASNSAESEEKNATGNSTEKKSADFPNAANKKYADSKCTVDSKLSLSCAELSVRIWFLRLIMLALPLLLSSTVNGAITRAYHVEKDSPKEAFSLPFQQTARYVKEYPEDVTEEEKTVIAKVLNYDQLPTLYTEDSADAVKTTYHARSTKELTDYLAVWFRMFLRHPLCYIEATWDQNYYAFMPDYDAVVYNQDVNYGMSIMPQSFIDEIGFTIPAPLQGAAITICSFYGLLNRLPVIGRLNNMGVSILLLFALCLFYARDCRRRDFAALIPGLMTFIFILLGPVIDVQPRYAFPILYALPLLMGYYIQAADSNSTPLN
jgi:hypothetical protein